MNKYEKKVAEDNVFYLSNGQVLSSLKDLYTGLDYMADDVFFHHVTPSRNDFATWTKEVIGDHEVAARIAGAGTPVMLKDVLNTVFGKETKTPRPAAAKKAAVTKTASKTKAAPSAKTKKA